MWRVARCGVFLLGLALCSMAHAVDVQPIGDDQLQAMIKAELGDAYRPGSAANYLTAHQSLEKFFATTDTKQRNAIVATLQQSGIDPNVLGRLARLRENWPALAPGSVTEIQDHLGPIKVHYFLGVPPKYDRSTAWPLVIKLAELQDFAANPKPSADDLRRIYTDWINQEIAHHPSAVVLMPVLDLQSSWGPSYQGMNAAIGAMQHAASQANIDPARVYLIGHGGAANAVWNLATLHPTYFAAINPLSASALQDWQRVRLTNLHNLLVISWHGTADKISPPEVDRNLATMLQRLKVDVDYTETPAVARDPTPAILDACYDKLLARKRELYPKEISLDSNRPDTAFNRIDWLQIYQPTDGGEEKRIIFKRVPGQMTVMSNDWSASALIAANHIEMHTDNIRLLRLYLNDQMVDLHEPVTVVVNGQQRFAGIVAPSVKQMLGDQIFLGRGWRYFSGVIDIDLTPKAATTNSTANH